MPCFLIHFRKKVVLEVGLDSNEVRTDVLLFNALSQESGAGSRTRTYEARRREIYSLLSLPLDDSSSLIIIWDFHKKINFIKHLLIFKLNPFSADMLFYNTRQGLFFDGFIYFCRSLLFWLHISF